MRTKLFLLFAACLTISLCLPLVSGADEVPWSTESYHALAEEWWGASDEEFGPPLPLSTSVYATCGSSAYAYASSDITSTSMIVSTGGVKSGNMCVNDSYAEAEFEGTYTANNSFFIFYYDYSVAGSGLGFDAWGSLYIENVSSSTILFDQSLGLSDITDTLNVHTSIGDEILVRMNVNSNTCCDGDVTSTLNYNMSTSVVPEPVSSILFVTGGAFLTGRRYLKRRKIA